LLYLAETKELLRVCILGDTCGIHYGMTVIVTAVDPGEAHPTDVNPSKK
jgi:hypothetical protein